jgi:hypothetical protein
MGLFESIQRSRQNIDDLANGLRGYMQKKKQEDAQNEFYGRLKQLTQKTEQIPFEEQAPQQNADVSKVQPAMPQQTQAAPRAQMNAPIQPMQPAGMSGVPTQTQTRQVDSGLTGRQKLVLALKEKPPQTPEEWAVVKQYADQLDITEPKPETFTAARGSGIFQKDANGNIVQVGSVPGQKAMDRKIGETTDPSNNHKILTMEDENGNQYSVDAGETTVTKHETPQERKDREHSNIEARASASAKGGGSKTNAKQAWESEKSAILKATKNAIADEDWDKPYSEVRSKLRGLGLSPQEAERRWYRANQLKSKAEVSGEIEKPKTETPKTAAVDPNDPMGILK